MNAAEHKATAEEHVMEATIANQNGQWETARFEMQLAKFHIEAAAVEQTGRIADLLERVITPDLIGRSFLRIDGIVATEQA